MQHARDGRAPSNLLLGKNLDALLKHPGRVYAAPTRALFLAQLGQDLPRAVRRDPPGTPNPLIAKYEVRFVFPTSRNRSFSVHSVII
jgi:hypothetical protein